MENKEILVAIRNVYGKEIVYPFCPTAKSFAKLVGQKTLTYQSIQTIKELGYTVTVVSEHQNTL